MIRRILNRLTRPDDERQEFSEAQQKDWYRHHKQTLTLGQRAADAMRNGMGSWRFVIASIVFLAAWVETDGAGFDPPPYFILNLLLSCVAALQGAILLIAAKRADEVAASLARYDAEVNIESEKRIEELQVRIAVLENEKHEEILDGIAEILAEMKGVRR
jgi:uncharacterized membrane protein